MDKFEGLFVGLSVELDGRGLSYSPPIIVYFRRRKLTCKS